MKAHRYSFLTLALVALTFLFSGQALAADIDAKLADSDNTSSFQVKDSADNVLMQVQSGGNVGIGTTTKPGKLVFPASHYGVKIELYKAGEERIGTANNQLQLISGNLTGANIAFFGAPAGSASLTEVMRVGTDSGGKVGIGTTAPNSTLQVNGSVSVKYLPASAGSSSIPTAGATIIGVSGGSATVELAGADCVEGRIIFIKNESVDSNIAITTQSAGSIDGNTSGPETPGVSISSLDSLQLYAKGNNIWFILGKYTSPGY